MKVNLDENKLNNVTQKNQKNIDSISPKALSSVYRCIESAGLNASRTSLSDDAKVCQWSGNAYSYSF